MNSLQELANAQAANITTATTTTVKTGPGTLVRILVNTPVSGATITVYDNTAASGTKLGTIGCGTDATLKPFPVEFGVSFTIGLTIVTSGATDITAIYR